MAQHVQLTVKIGGSNISPISYCSINQRIDWHHSFNVALSTESFTKNYSDNLNKAKDFIGKKIEIAFKVVIPEESSVMNEFSGIITEVSLNRSNLGNKEILVSGYSPTVLLDRMPNCRSFTEKTLNDIITDLHQQIPQNDLKINSDPVFTGEIPFIVQYKESNYHFLNRIADKYGEWCFYNGTELVFGRLDKGQAIDLHIDTNLSDFEYSLRLQNLNFNAVAYDYLENTTYTKDTKSIQINDLDQYGDHALAQSDKVFKQLNTLYSPENFKDNGEFLHYHETKKTTQSKDLIFNKGTSDDSSINVGKVINIKGEHANEEDFGKFIITSIVHNIGIAGEYQNRFTAIPVQANTPPVNRNITQPQSEFQPAVVTDNDDPEKLGRIKVRFFWQTSQDSTPWLRIVHAHGGKTDNGEQHGFYFIPEINDEVMVGFENENPDKPFVMGNVYHKNSKPDHWHHADNNIKSIRTRNGNQIIFIDDDGNEEIRILNKDDASPTNEISLSLSNNGKITIKSEGELEISAKSIKISAQDDIVIDSGQNTKLTANDYQLDANNAIKLTGQQLDIEGTNTSIKGQAELKLEGTQTKIDATALKMEGNGQAELKGAMVKVEGSGTTIIKGALVQIN